MNRKRKGPKENPSNLAFNTERIQNHYKHNKINCIKTQGLKILEVEIENNCTESVKINNKQKI